MPHVGRSRGAWGLGSSLLAVITLKISRSPTGSECAGENPIGAALESHPPGGGGLARSHGIGGGGGGWSVPFQLLHTALTCFVTAQSAPHRGSQPPTSALVANLDLLSSPALIKDSPPPQHNAKTIKKPGAH